MMDEQRGIEQLEAEIQECMRGLALCSGCEEVWVKIPAPEGLAAVPVYCKFCECVKQALEDDYHVARRRLFRSLPGRVPAGVVPFQGSAVRRPGMVGIVIVEAAAMAIVVATCVGLYALVCCGARIVGAQ